MEREDEYGLYETFGLSGSFRALGNSDVVGGIFHYIPHRLPRVEVFCFTPEDTTSGLKNFIAGRVYKDKHFKCVHGVLEGQVAFTGLHAIKRLSRGSVYGFEFNYLLNDVIIGQLVYPGDLVSNLYIQFNLWEEFCFCTLDDHGDKKDINDLDVYVSEDLTISINVINRFEIKCENQILDMFDTDANDKYFFEEFKFLIQKCKERNAKEPFMLLTKKRENCFVDFKVNRDVMDLDIEKSNVIKFSNFLTVLTKFPAAPTFSKVLVRHSIQEEEDYVEASWLFSGLLPSNVVESASEKFNNRKAPITLSKIGSSWPRIVSSFFTQFDSLKKYVSILLANLTDNVSHIFKYTRTVDALEIFAKYQFGKLNFYSNAIDNYAFQDLKNSLLKSFDAVDVNDLGKKISATRAFVVHGDLSHKEIFDKVSESPVYFELIELVLYSYVQNIIGVPDDLRKEFQNYWVAKYNDMCWLNLKQNASGDG